MTVAHFFPVCRTKHTPSHRNTKRNEQPDHSTTTMNLDHSSSSTASTTSSNCIISLTHKADLRPQESLPLRQHHYEYATGALPRGNMTIPTSNNMKDAIDFESSSKTSASLLLFDHHIADSLKKPLNNNKIVSPSKEVFLKMESNDVKQNPAVSSCSDHSSSVGSSSSSSSVKKEMKQEAAARRKNESNNIVLHAELKQETAKTNRSRQNKSNVMAEIKIVSQTSIEGAPYYSKRQLQQRAKLLATLQPKELSKNLNSSSKEDQVDSMAARAQIKLKSPKPRQSRLLGDVQKHKELQQQQQQQRQAMAAAIPAPPVTAAAAAATADNGDYQQEALEFLTSEQGELYQSEQKQQQQQQDADAGNVSDDDVGDIDDHDKTTTTTRVSPLRPGIIRGSSVGTIVCEEEEQKDNQVDKVDTSTPPPNSVVNSLRPGVIRGLSVGTIREDEAEDEEKDKNCVSYLRPGMIRGLSVGSTICEESQQPKQEEGLNDASSASSNATTLIANNRAMTSSNHLNNSSSHHTSTSTKSSSSSRSTSSDSTAARVQITLKSPKPRQSRLLGDIQKHMEQHQQQQQQQRQTMAAAIPAPPVAAAVVDYGEQQDAVEAIEKKQPVPSTPRAVMTQVMTHPLAKKAANGVFWQEHDSLMTDSKTCLSPTPHKRESRILTCLKKQQEQQEQLKLQQQKKQQQQLQQQEQNSPIGREDDSNKKPPESQATATTTTTREPELTSCSSAGLSLSSLPSVPSGTPSWAGTIVLKSPKKTESRILGHFIKQPQHQP
jgi:hypothetical protein